MSVRRSERLAQLWLAKHPPASTSTVDALNEMYEVAMEAFTAVHRVHMLIKERATFEESRTAIASLIQVIWAIEDSHEFKTRQLMGDKGEQALLGHNAFMEQLRTLTKEAEDIAAVFSQHVTLSASLVSTAKNLGTDVVKTFYIN